MEQNIFCLSPHFSLQLSKTLKVYYTVFFTLYFCMRSYNHIHMSVYTCMGSCQCSTKMGFCQYSFHYFTPLTTVHRCLQVKHCITKGTFKKFQNIFILLLIYSFNLQYKIGAKQNLISLICICLICSDFTTFFFLDNLFQLSLVFSKLPAF